MKILQHIPVTPMAPKTQTGKIRSSQQFSALLSSAILEWVLMLLLLLEGLLSYLVTTFARLCKLQPPCLMCTRLDHVLGKAQPGFYRDLLCNGHKAEASSWAFCHIHRKLADVHSMCEACLLSFATEKKSNLQTYQSLVGKLSVRVDSDGRWHDLSWSYAAEAPSLKEDTFCSCCSSLTKTKSHAFVSLQSKASGMYVEEIAGDDSRNHGVDKLNYVEYSELKTSDSESEAPKPGGNVRSLLVDATDDLEQDDTSGGSQTEPSDNIPPDNNAQEKVAYHYDSIPGLPVQHGGSDNMLSQTSGDSCDLQSDGKADLRSPGLYSKDAQQVTEDSCTRVDKLEDNVWHDAPSGTNELSIVAESTETNTKTSEMKPEFTNAITRKDSYRVHEDLKLLLSQASASQVPDSWNDFVASPCVEERGEQAILRHISRTISLERNCWGLSESMASEVEGESSIDQLKRQVELDRKSISLLWKELEEERNAAAVAANQAMAMITRLQEEKAAMQMEASQYQRMMEEQSEYDREDLQKTTNLVQKLEADIDSYKSKLKDALLTHEIRDQMHLSSSQECGPSISRTTESLSGFEDEKVYISKCLRKLKRKLHQFSNNSKFIEPSNLSNEEDALSDRNSEDAYVDADEDGEVENLVPEKCVRGANNFKYISIGIKNSACSKHDPKGQYCAMISENDLASFEDEIYELSGRLKALEADHSFLEHSINSLKNGKEGTEFIHDIAYDLQKLRKMGITWKEYD